MADKSKSYGDKDIATNLLVTLKHMKAELNTFTQEASNDELFTKIDEVYTCVSTLQRDVFNMMTEQGWYKMTADSAKNISKAYTKFSKSESNRCTMLVDNVHTFPTHIACDSASNSEIVIPIIKENTLLGVLDVDSPVFARFDSVDQQYLEQALGILLQSL